MKKFTFSLDEKLIQRLRQCGVDNLSDLINTLLRAWLNSLQDKGNIVELAVKKTELLEFMKEAFAQAEKEALEAKR